MAFTDLFIGVPQSKYAGLAFLITLIIVGIALLVSKEQIPLTQKFIVVLLMVLLAAPSILVSLFQLTCIVTGDRGGDAWWCGAYGWLISALIMVSSLLVIFTAINSISAEVTVEKFIDSKRELSNLDAANQLTEQFYGRRTEHFTGSSGATATATIAVPTSVAIPPASAASHPAVTNPPTVPSASAMPSALPSASASALPSALPSVLPLPSASPVGSGMAAAAIQSGAPPSLPTLPPQTGSPALPNANVNKNASNTLAPFSVTASVPEQFSVCASPF